MFLTQNVVKDFTVMIHAAESEEEVDYINSLWKNLSTEKLAEASYSEEKIPPQDTIAAPGIVARRNRKQQHPERTCLICGKKFVPTNTRQIYCSPACKQTACYRMKTRGTLGMPQKICQVCGKKFTPDRTDQKYCCKKCKNFHAQQQFQTRAQQKKLSA